MSFEEKFLGNIISFDPDLEVFTIKAKFLSEEKKEVLFDIYKSEKDFTFTLKKPYKENKSTKQLRTYFMLLGQILDKLDIPKDKDVIAEFDRQILTTMFPCRFLDVFGQSVPIPPSKSEMTKEEMTILIQNILEAYKELNLKIESYD